MLLLCLSASAPHLFTACPLSTRPLQCNTHGTQALKPARHPSIRARFVLVCTTHLVTQLRPHLLSHALSHSDCGHSPWLCACNGTPLGKAALQQELGYLGGLAAPGFPHQHQGLVFLDLKVTMGG